MLRRALVGLFAGGRATADMAEEAAAAAEVGKAFATLGEPRPETRADPRSESRHDQDQSRVEALR
jgi:hypothetical protein